MAEIIRATGFVNNLQQLVMPSGFSANVVAYLWGGGGGGGGNDSHRGGNGCGAMCAVQSFTVSPGDVIDVAVGGGGQHGGTGAGQSSGPGIPGAGYTIDNTVFTTLDLLGPGITRHTNNVYPTFLNTYGVWGSSNVFDQTVNVNFLTTEIYTFTGTCDNYFTVYVDGFQVLTGDNWRSIYNSKVLVPAGTHAVRILGHNISGPASIAVTIANNEINGSYCGGFGGAAGPIPFSGAGGAGGGATLLFKNSVLIAVAGGGAGGAGGGNQSNGQDAPGSTGQAAGTTAGQNGTNRSGDGGGGGGGGGGDPSGNGGSVPAGDTGGYSGFYGGSVGDVTYLPSNINPGGAALARYNGAGGQGGVYTLSGNPGYAVLVFEPTSYQVKFNNIWNPVQKSYVKVDGVWKESRNVFVKSNGVWNPIIGSSDDYAPTLSIVTGYFGTNPRLGVGGEPGGGGGGGKIICTKLYELGLMSKDIYEADQAFGAELVQVRPDIYNGYRAWAEIVVDWMDGRGPKMMPWMTNEEFSTAAAKWSTTWAQDIATPWAEEMAYRVGRTQQSNRIGRWIMAAGIPICKAVGVWQRWFGASKKPAGFGKGLMLIPVFVMFKLVAELGRLIERK